MTAAGRWLPVAAMAGLPAAVFTALSGTGPGGGTRWRWAASRLRPGSSRAAAGVRVIGKVLRGRSPSAGFAGATCTRSPRLSRSGGVGGPGTRTPGWLGAWDKAALVVSRPELG